MKTAKIKLASGLGDGIGRMSNYKTKIFKISLFCWSLIILLILLLYLLLPLIMGVGVSSCFYWDGPLC